MYRDIFGGPAVYLVAVGCVLWVARVGYHFFVFVVRVRVSGGEGTSFVEALALVGII